MTQVKKWECFKIFIGGLRHKAQLYVVWCHNASSCPAWNWLRSALFSWDLATHLYLKRDLRALSEELRALCVCKCECMLQKIHCWMLWFFFFYLFWTKQLSYLKEIFSTGMLQLSAQGEKRNIDVISRFVPCNLYCQWVGTQALQLVLGWSLHLDFFFFFPQMDTSLLWEFNIMSAVNCHRYKADVDA